MLYSESRYILQSRLIIFMMLFSFFSFITLIYGQNYPDEFLNGEIHRIHSDILNQERIIFIYLPVNYHEVKKSYPVHYVADAPGTSNMFYDLLRLHTITNSMPQSIVVGLSSDNREYNLHPEKGAGLYLEFIEKEVIPFIEGKYRTKPFRLLAGHSLSGGFTIYALLSRPDIFNAYIAGSPYPIKYYSNYIINKNPFSEIAQLDYKFFYISTGTINDIIIPDFSEFKQLLSKKASKNLEFHCLINEGENHISNIAINFQNGLKTFYRDWKFELPITLEEPIDKMLIKHYKNLENKVGYPIKIGEWEVIYPLMDKLAKRGDFKNAIKLLQYCIELYPQSDQAYAFLARAYINISDKESAKKYLEKALKINPNNKYASQIKKQFGLK